MPLRILVVLALGLWLVTAAGAGLFIYFDQQRQGADDRILIPVTQGERAFVMKEMRLMLEALQGIFMAMEAGDMDALAEAASSSGAIIKEALPIGLRARLPADFNRFSVDSHEGFMAMARAAKKGVGRDRMIALLSEQLGSCTACHDTYRFSLK